MKGLKGYWSTFSLLSAGLPCSAGGPVKGLQERDEGGILGGHVLDEKILHEGDDLFAWPFPEEQWRHRFAQDALHDLMVHLVLPEVGIAHLLHQRLFAGGIIGGVSDHV